MKKRFITLTDSELEWRNGQVCNVIGPLDESEYDKFATGPMFEIVFADGGYISAFEDELHDVEQEDTHNA